MIDTEGIVFYINDQCAKYLQVNKEDFLGKYVKDVFPETKMIEGLEKDEPSIVFLQFFPGDRNIHARPLCMKTEKR